MSLIRHRTLVNSATTSLFLILAAVAGPLTAQTLPATGSGKVLPAAPRSGDQPPFSRFAAGVGFSPLGARLELATYLNRYMNLRGSGNLCNCPWVFTDSDGLRVDAWIHLASAGSSLDYYPMPRRGLRISPGLLFYNTNRASGRITAGAGESFTLDNTTYYSSATHPLAGTGMLNLHTRSPAFTLTAGWGNPIARSGRREGGGRLTFPFEVGVVFAGAPSLDVTLNSGQVCDRQGHCENPTIYPEFQSDLREEVSKIERDLRPLGTYPIVSGGIAYSFGVHRGSGSSW